ncbi:MAG: hypothetical protein IKT40_12315 [Bacilli bacterium]|nr:hypothetical protein [Bacilli bacterium]
MEEGRVIKCSNCGHIITNLKAAIELDGEIFCCDLCVEEYEFLNLK